MAITSYEKNGRTLWRVYVNLRSKENNRIREQKVVLDLESEKAAVAEEKKLLKELAATVTKREGLGLEWGGVIARWELEMRGSPVQKLDPTTIQDFISMLRRWTTAWLDRPAAQLNRGDGRAILDHMEALGKSRSFQAKVKSAINQVYTWGIEGRLIPGVFESPVAGVKLMKVEDEKLPEILSLDEIRTLLREAKRLEHPWYPIWAMAMLTGMRNGELHALLWSDVDLEGRLIRLQKAYNTRKRMVKSTKGKYWRNIPISTQLHELLVELKANSDGSLNVLPRFRDWNKGEQARILRTFCKGIGITSIKFHTLRACFGTQLLAHDIAPARVMKVAGWKDLKTMQRYIRLAGVEEKGATECLKVLASDAEVMSTVVNLLEFKAKHGAGAPSGS